MPTQLNQNTTDLQSILDAVNAMPDASNTEIGVSYNADGTQNLIIKDDGSVIEIPDPNPVLLWTNASPTSAFAAQTVSLSTGYSAYLVEIQTNTSQTGKNITFLPFGNTTKYLWAWTLQLKYYNGYRIVTSAGDGSITFGSGSSDMNGTFNVDTYGIPTRIWGVKFTL